MICSFNLKNCVFYLTLNSNMVDYIDEFSNIEPALNPWNKPHLVMVYGSFISAEFYLLVFY